jgi:prefoldin subunit 5
MSDTSAVANSTEGSEKQHLAQMAFDQKSVTLLSRITEGKNPRGIPGAKFIENVADFLSSGTTIEAALGALNELYSKYKFMEKNFDRSKDSYNAKLPEIESTLELITAMKKRNEAGEKMFTNYNLNDTVFARAELNLSEEKVCLWIGANTMIEYSFDEALELLKNQLEASHFKIAELQEDLDFLRGNSITVEVNMARLFNYSVKLKKAAEAAAIAAGP